MSQAFGAKLQERLGRRAHDVLAHPHRRLHVFTSRGRHLLGREGRLRTPAGYLGAFVANAASRRALGGWLERVVFGDPRDALPFPLHDYRSRHCALDPDNLAPAILASCSIPFWLDAVHDVPGGPRGAYWDGGITDYHLHLDYAAMDDGLVLYPHFQRHVVPGWLDKAWKRRHRASALLDNVVVLAPSPGVGGDTARRQAARPQPTSRRLATTCRAAWPRGAARWPKASAWPTSSPSWWRGRHRCWRSRCPDGCAKLSACFTQQGRERHTGYDTADYEHPLHRGLVGRAAVPVSLSPEQSAATPALFSCPRGFPMIQITLPDGSRREFPGPVTVAEVAASIGAGLAKAALAGRVDGRLVDTSHRIDADAQLAIVTDKDADGLEIIRHSTAHLLAYAVKELFPDAQVTIGPVIENGFYYDFAYKRPFTPEDLAAIEKRMGELAAKNEPVVRRVLPRDEAVAYFKSQGEHYKAEIIGSIPAGEDVSLYREGGFEDLCRGPHVPSTGRLKHFKLMKVAGAYWRGDQKNEQLQRIYGTAWASKDALQGYLTMLEEAEKRDHRKLGRELDLFHLDEHSARHGVLAPQGLDGVAGGRAVHARRLPRQRLPRGQGPADPGPRAVGEDGPLGQVPRQHVHDGVGEARLRAEADELPGPHPDLQAGHQELPRPAAALRRVRPVPPQRAHRRRCTASCACAASRRTTATSSAPKSTILDECVAYTALLQKVYKDFGFDDIIYKVATRPEARIGSRRPLGQGRISR